MNLQSLGVSIMEQLFPFTVDGHVENDQERVFVIRVKAVTESEALALAITRAAAAFEIGADEVVITNVSVDLS